MKVNKKQVGQRIKLIRLNKGYTLDEFGKIFNADKSSVLGWENGRSLPNKDRIKQISKFADITVNELLYGKDNEFQVTLQDHETEKIKQLATEYNTTTSDIITTLLKGVLNEQTL